MCHFDAREIAPDLLVESDPPIIPQLAAAFGTVAPARALDIRSDTCLRALRHICLSRAATADHDDLALCEGNRVVREQLGGGACGSPMTGGDAWRSAQDRQASPARRFQNLACKLERSPSAVADLTKRQLLELSAVRNCLAHRRGIVDARFLKACGTTTLTLGEPILLTSNHLLRYYCAADHYAMTVLERVKMQYDPDRSSAPGPTGTLRS
jgi:hypothetical protein